ncbi:MAG: hypothetical protein ACT4P2_03580 [Pseudomonadota bacterium]
MSARLAATRVLAAAVALVLLGLAFRPASHVYDMPLTEDGYYALTVARNLARGLGPTIDGAALTNGFQPLFTVIEAGAFALAGANELLALRLVMAAAWLFHALGALLVGLIARDAWPTRPGAPEDERRLEKEWRLWLAAFLYLAAPLMLNHAYNGLETGCVMFFYALAWRFVQAGRERSAFGLAAFGTLAGLMVLARIDAAFLALALGLNELRRSRQRGPAVALARASLFGGAALIVSLPWWLYNLIWFGSPMPTSGAAQQEWAIDFLRFEFAEWALRIAAVPWLFAGAHETAFSLDLTLPLAAERQMTVTPIGTLRALVLIAAAVVAWRAWRGGQFARELAAASADEAPLVRRGLEFAAVFGWAWAALVAYYTLSFVAYWFFYRYFAPAALIAVVIAAVVWARLAVHGRSPAWRLARAGIAVGLAAQIGVLALWAQAGRGLGGDTVYHDQVALVRAHVPDGEPVAAGQSGTLGFFRAQVVNLDGKVNREALAYQDRMWDYLRERDISWFVDWPYYAGKYLGEPPASRGWRLVGERNYFHLYEYVGPRGR